MRPLPHLGPDADLGGGLGPGSADRLLEALDPEQREVALALQGPVRVLAGAGTGKTRAITHRMAYGVATGVYNPTEVLAVTVTTRAAGEMRGRLRALGAAGVQARTFHSAALRQARYFWPRVYGGELPVLTESKLPLIGNAARRNRVQADQATLRDLASEVEWAKVSNVRPDDYATTTNERVLEAVFAVGNTRDRGFQHPFGVVLERREHAHGTKTLLRLGQAGRKADPDRVRTRSPWCWPHPPVRPAT